MKLEPHPFLGTSMEFSIGISPARSERPRRKQQKFAPVKPSGKPVRFENDWLLKPHENWQVTHFIQQIADSNISAIGEIRREIKKQTNKFPDRRYILVPAGTEVKFLKDGLQHLAKNQKLINTFRNLARRWILKRFKAGNEEDLLTGEIPKNPVILHVWSQRTFFTFEASTIMRDMLERLLSQDYLFPKYLRPRNPYTNCNLTASQFFSVMHALRKAGRTHWVLEALFECGYNMVQFKEKFGGIMKKEIILREYIKPGADTLDIVYDFIASHFDKIGKPFYGPLYRWGLASARNNLRIRAWMNLSKDYHLIIYTDGGGKKYDEERKRIDDAAKNLADTFPGELYDLYEKEVGPITITPEPEVTPQVEVDTPDTITYRTIDTASGIITVINDTRLEDLHSWSARVYIYQAFGREEPELTLDGFWPENAFDGFEDPA